MAEGQAARLPNSQQSEKAEVDWPHIYFIGPRDLFGTITSFDLFAKAAETGYD